MAGATYSVDGLLHLLHSDGADELRVHVGRPPVLVLDGEEQPVDGPAITADDAHRLWQSLSTSRHRRTLAELGSVTFLHRFRGRATFVVHASADGPTIGMVIH